MSSSKRKQQPDLDVSLQVDAESLEQLQTLCGQQIMRTVIWEDSVADALGAEDLTAAATDIDVYLANGVLFELYGVLCYPSLDSDPLCDIELTRQYLNVLADSDIWLDEIAVDTEDDLVLVVSNGSRPVAYLNAGAWSIDEWEVLPE
jgi:hypothetical protein